MQSVVVGTSEPFRQTQKIRVRQATVGHPKIFVEPGGLDDERIAVPAPDGAPVIQRVVVVSADLPDCIAAVQVDDAIVAVAAAQQHENAFPRSILDESQAEVGLILTGATRA